MTRVLIVDDEPSIRLTLSTLLRLEGYDVDSAADGQAALQRVQDNPPDLVISDVNMPHLSGYELLAAIRANPVLTAVRFVILAEPAHNDPAASHAQSQADACVTKPFTRARLLTTLRSLAP